MNREFRFSDTFMQEPVGCMETMRYAERVSRAQRAAAQALTSANPQLPALQQLRLLPARHLRRRCCVRSTAGAYEGVLPGMQSRAPARQRLVIISSLLLQCHALTVASLQQVGNAYVPRCALLKALPGCVDMTVHMTHDMHAGLRRRVTALHLSIDAPAGKHPSQSHAHPFMGRAGVQTRRGSQQRLSHRAEQAQMGCAGSSQEAATPDALTPSPDGAHR